MFTDQGDTVTVDTLALSLPQETFSIGRFIPVNRTDAYTLCHTLTPPPVSAIYAVPEKRFDGDPLPAEKINTDFCFIILAVSLLTVTILAVFGRKSIVSGLASLSFRKQQAPVTSGTSELYAWQPFFRNIFTILNTGLFAATSLLLTGLSGYNTPSDHIRLTAIMSGAVLAALMLRHLGCIIIAGITRQRSLFREYINVVYNAWFALSVLLSILTVLIVYAPVDNVFPFILAGLIITGLFLIIRTLRLLVIFHKWHVSISYFILYLCALEVLPALVILKILGVF